MEINLNQILVDIYAGRMELYLQDRQLSIQLARLSRLTKNIKTGKRWAGKKAKDTAKVAAKKPSTM